MTSTPSMPDSESSSGFVTWDSITSADAPRYTVVTFTIGSSILGNSRTDNREYEIMPISTITNDITVANTGRLMQISDRTMVKSLSS